MCFIKVIISVLLTVGLLTFITQNNIVFANCPPNTTCQEGVPNPSHHHGSGTQKYLTFLFESPEDCFSLWNHLKVKHPK
jgi:hypothetical protein